MKSEKEVITYLNKLREIEGNSVQKDIAIKILEWVLECEVLI